MRWKGWREECLCDAAWRQGTNAQVLALWLDEGAAVWPLLKIPIPDTLDKVPTTLGPFISVEVMLVWAALMTMSFGIELHASILIVSTLGEICALDW
jgi:hypothetical protein